MQCIIITTAMMITMILREDDHLDWVQVLAGYTVPLQVRIIMII